MLSPPSVTRPVLASTTSVITLPAGGLPPGGMAAFLAMKRPLIAIRSVATRPLQLDQTGDGVEARRETCLALARPTCLG